MLTGGCHCQAIRYQSTSDIGQPGLCHCSDCRSASGAPCVAWFSVPAGQFHYTRGRPVYYRSSGHATRAFCGACGTQLSFADDAFPGEIDITTCSLDEPGRAAPAYHIHTASQLPWLMLADTLPRFRRKRSDG